MEPSKNEPRIRVAAIVLREDAILLVKHAKAGRAYWMLPGGGVDYGESLTKALAREVREETCVEIEANALVLVNDSIPPDGHRHILNLYFTADLIVGEARTGIDPRVVEAAFLPVAQLTEVAFFPDFGGELKAMIAAGFPNSATYLGNLWKD